MKKAMSNSCPRSHLIKGFKETVPMTEEELADTKYNYKVHIFEAYGRYHPLMEKLRKQGRLVTDSKGLVY